MRNKFIALIRNGKIGFLSSYNKALFNEWLKDNEGHKIEIKRVSSKVSDNRRAWYFGAVIPFMKQLVGAWQNLSDEQIHEVLKTEFNGFTIKDKFGKDRKYPQPVANRDVDTEQFDNYIMRIAEWVLENYNQTLPDPQQYKDLMDKAELR